MDKLLELKDKELEKAGASIFRAIGLDCFYDLGQVPLKKITSGYPENQHLEFDYMIPEDKVCLIGEITSRTDTDTKKRIESKYDKFIKHINIIKKLEFSDDIWQNLGIKQESIRKFRNIQSIKGFFITTTKERFDLNLPKVEDVVVFYKSDFMRLSEYSQNIGIWTRNYFFNKFSLDHRTNNSISIYEKDHQLIRSTNNKISKKYEDDDAPLSDLYTFTISPYEILDIVHVYRQDELPSLHDSSIYNYQRPLNSDKLKEIRKNLLTDCDFIFPSNILVILSKECKYTKDGNDNFYLHIPKKYGSISVIDGQHRLFSYADEDIKSIMQNDCKIMVTAVSFKTEVQEIITKFSARVFIEININQTKVEIAHLDKIAYELGSNDSKAIATKIIVSLNTREKFRGFFGIASDKTNKGIIESGIIIDTIKKITNIRKIKELTKARVNKTKLKKDGYEKLFSSTIAELSERDILVEKGTILLERYFNYVFSSFPQDKDELKSKKEVFFTSFIYSKFWCGWINLLIIFIEEGLHWDEIKQELNNIKKNVMTLLEITKYDRPLFQPNNPKIPDSSSSPKKVGEFLNKNRTESCSIQDV
ncbi:DGQHR domain-containing protein [Dapis sp. BLCC M126]|uniref:DGQHR domain-containing protein n=1 Tax=Dapis sp. BLCC M126 TaxID=3400189 RepID=UPI003CF576BC